ncbi:MAG TPA: DUF2007 domain-containing protein [Bacteroidales bacterium]|nr:DUF2007 domain-containing protein [Bacteroidales bacterium]HPS62039.1 DUF2007 domain-containing protein [Bacteroidales bacterium]
MTDTFDDHLEDPVEVFSGTGWEAAIVQSLLENADIIVFVYYGGRGTMAPWDSGGGQPLNRLVVPRRDEDKAREVIRQYFEAIRP